jgi:hypothetical protein
VLGDENSRSIIVNMRVGDNWYFTGYKEQNGKFYHWDYYKTFRKLKRLIDHYLSRRDDEED